VTPISTECAEQVSISRERLVETAFGLVENLRVAGPRASGVRGESYSHHYQVCLPYHGAFVWHVGRDDVVADPNRVLFVRGEEEFGVSRPVSGGYGELIVTARPDLLADLLEVPERRLADHVLFRQRSAPASAALQRRGIEFLHAAAAGDAGGCGDRDGSGDGGLAAEEWMVSFVRASLASAGAADAAHAGDAIEVSPSTLRLVGRAKTYLAANLSEPMRLERIARAAGTTPAYLTSMFRRVEGRPLHKYLVQLRLARALVELPKTTDLTALACELGFSSHSHFTAVFRRTFGCTPSTFRDSMHMRRGLQRGSERGSQRGSRCSVSPLEIRQLSGHSAFGLYQRKSAR
jgi:AraC family transcriptional regulator